jgi:hypothetical protein
MASLSESQQLAVAAFKFAASAFILRSLGILGDTSGFVAFQPYFFCHLTVCAVTP